MNFLKEYKKSLKSTETEDWLDLRIVRPVSYLLALFFNLLNVHPNTVTILSMIVGVASCWGYIHGSFYYEGTSGLTFNIIACALLLFADILDCTDGQLARLSGKKSKWGRILDGMAGPVWFVPIYLTIVYRFYLHHSIEFSFLGLSDTAENAVIATIVVLVLALISGFWGMTGQQRIADYYIQIHLFMLGGAKSSELDTAEAQMIEYKKLPKDCNPVWKLFQKQYIGYTQKQEESTPEFQKLMAKLKNKYGDCDKMPGEIRQKLLDCSRSIMALNAMLTFNFRTGFFFLFCLLDVPVMNFLFEIVILGLLTAYIKHRHETFCKQLNSNIL